MAENQRNACKCGDHAAGEKRHTFSACRKEHRPEKGRCHAGYRQAKLERSQGGGKDGIVGDPKQAR